MGRKKKTPQGPLLLPSDSEHIREVIAWALKEGLPISRPEPDHLKIGPIDYYPAKHASNSEVVGPENHQHQKGPQMVMCTLPADDLDWLSDWPHHLIAIPIKD